MTPAERWVGIHKRLIRLEYSDQMEESELLSEAYDSLLEAYQEARSLNVELEELLQEYMHI